MPRVASDITQISATTHQIPYTISCIGATLQISEESTVGEPTNVTVSSSRSSPIVSPTVPSGVMSLERPSRVELTVVQLDDISHAPGAPSSSPATALPDNGLEVTVLDTHVFSRRDTQHARPP